MNIDRLLPTKELVELSLHSAEDVVQRVVETLRRNHDVVKLLNA